jgi:RNA methyltransferase, TrmH family
MTQTGQITSLKDPRVAGARELTAASARARLHKCLLEGSESIAWAIEAQLPIEHVFYSASHEQEPVLSRLRQQHIPCYPTSDGLLKKISDTSYLVPLLGVARIPRALTEPETMGDFVVVLDRVQDHGNIGTIVRTASAFGIRDIVSTTSSLDLFYKKIISASRGRVFETRVQRFGSGGEALAALKRQGYQVIATSPYARDIQAMAPLQARPVALVVGNETEGIADDIVRNADIVVQIPMSGQVESLNVGVATGISLYELKFRMVLTMLIDYIRSNTGREVNITGRLIVQAFDAQIRKVSDLTGQQAILLMILVCDQSMTREQVMRDTGALPHELDALLQPLIEQNYIRYTDATQDSIAPTESSERILAQLWSIVERAEQNVLAGFSDQEKAQLRDFLKRIQENCARIVEDQTTPFA